MLRNGKKMLLQNRTPQIHIDSNELAAAEWFERSEIPNDSMKGSIAHEMIEAFRIQLC